MLGHEELEDKQNEIYTGIKARGDQALREGFKSDPTFTERKGGYMLCLRPHSEVARQIAAITSALTIDGIFWYDERILHTTISDYRVAAGFNPDEDPEREKILSVLIEVADGVAKQVGMMAAHYCSDGFAFDEKSVLYVGRPWMEQRAGKNLWQVGQKAIELAKERDVSLRMPWSAHITCGRVWKPVAAGQVQEIAKVLTEKAPRRSYLGEDTMELYSTFPYNVAFPFESIFVGRFRASLKTFDVKVEYERRLSL